MDLAIVEAADVDLGGVRAVEPLLDVDRDGPGRAAGVAHRHGPQDALVGVAGQGNRVRRGPDAAVTVLVPAVDLVGGDLGDRGRRARAGRRVEGAVRDVDGSVDVDGGPRGIGLVVVDARVEAADLVAARACRAWRRSPRWSSRSRCW